MHTNHLSRSVKAVLAIAIAVASLGVFAPPASAAGVSAAAVRQVRGTQVLDDTTTAPECDSSLATFVMSGSLDGCWLTLTFDFTFTPSGVMKSSGTERFIGCLNGTVCGTFDTTFIFMAKFDLTTGFEIRGRCQHPIVTGSGFEGFDGVTGRLDFKDVVADGSYVYRGHLTLP